MDIEPEDPTTYGWAFGAYERVGPDTGALKLSGASFDVKVRRDPWKKEQPLPREYEFLSEDADASGLIMSFLMTGTFPKHPHASVRSTSDMTTEFIYAGELSFKLGLRCIKRFRCAVSLHLRQLLLEDRTALLERHITSLYKLLARRSAKFDTIWDGDDPEEWSIIVKHCLGLIGQSERFKADVRWYMIQTLENRTKFSSVIAVIPSYLLEAK
ncbi:hypothetical protein CTAM01_11823 [Colletotrichum tamarilloi]|uniref:Uncharacterized protein n=1 Tax=Colletotrichum tamarilloi TaxID=1209934 RepID=A0ABQ9QWG1_9PEZI|nr:uncharacterized protein CTAM01_11823 [Colletotrichum tamarilloi]KAK1487366.1 hypothetical protein CTAM01_11823 [Colletotrichum tamarilloi]